MEAISPDSYDAVVFDLDGTLSDSSEAVIRQLRVLVEEFGTAARTDEDIIEACHVSGGSIRRIVPDLLGISEEALVDKAHARHSEIIPTTKSLMKPYLGALALLEVLHDVGKKIGMYTSRDRRMLQDDACELLLPHVEAIVTVEDVAEPKPQPEGVLLAMEALGVAPERCLYVGDTTADVMCGLAAGVRTIGISHGFDTDGNMRAAGAQYIVHDIAGLRKLILDESGTIEV